MAKHKLSPYRVKLRQDHKTGMKVRPKDLWELDNLAGMNPGLKKFDNFIDLMEGFLKHLRDVGYINDNVKRALTVTEFESGVGDFDSNAEARTVEAELTYGRYNRVADHNDKNSYGESSRESPLDSRKENQRDRDTVAETRLHFLAHVPTNSNRSAFFVLHSYGKNAVKTRLKDAFYQYILSKYDSTSVPFALGSDRRKDTFKLEMNTVAGPDLVDELKKAKIVGFEVHKRDTNVPEYMSESTSLSNKAEGNLTIQFTSDDVLSDLRMKKQSLGEKIRNEDYPLAELVDDDPSRANAIVENPDGKNRRMAISREEIRMEKVIDSTELKYDPGGRVNTGSVGNFSRTFINEKLQAIGADTLDEESLLK